MGELMMAIDVVGKKLTSKELGKGRVPEKNPYFLWSFAKPGSM